METKTLTQSSVRARVEADVAQRCAAAKILMSAGNYEGAREALGELWDGIGSRPRIEGFAPNEQAELLLRAGALSGWLGSSGQVPAAQGFAKDLISESIRTFELLGAQERVAEAQ